MTNVSKESSCEINGYPNYIIYRNGDIYSNCSKRFIKCCTDRGYVRVKLYNNKIGKKFSLHRLVAEHFIENKFGKKGVVNHIDNNPLNCVDTNLEWLLQKGNVRYIYEQDRKKKTPIVQLDKDYRIIKFYDYISDAVKETKVDKSSIIRCCKGKQKTAGGYKWEYTTL